MNFTPMDEYIIDNYAEHSIVKKYNINPEVLGIDLGNSEDYLWAVIFIRVDNEIEAKKYGGK